MWERGTAARNILEDQVARVAGMLGTTGSELRRWIVPNRLELGLDPPAIGVATGAGGDLRQPDRPTDQKTHHD